MKIVVILAVIVVLLLGGGGAAYFFRDALFGAGGEKAETETELKTPDALFVDLESINIAVIHNRRIEKHVVLQVTLEVFDEETRAMVAKSLPRIKDSFIKDMYDYYAVQTPGGGGGVDVEAIKKRLKRTVDTVMGPNVIRSVLIQGAVERETNSN